MPGRKELLWPPCCRLENVNDDSVVEYRKVVLPVEPKLTTVSLEKEENVDPEKLWTSLPFAVAKKDVSVAPSVNEAEDVSVALE